MNRLEEVVPLGVGSELQPPRVRPAPEPSLDANARLLGLFIRRYRLEDIRWVLERMDCRHARSLPADNYCGDCGAAFGHG